MKAVGFTIDVFVQGDFAGATGVRDEAHILCHASYLGTYSQQKSIQRRHRNSVDELLLTCVRMECLYKELLLDVLGQCCPRPRPIT